MSTQELVYNLPKLSTRSLKRKFLAAKFKSQRLAKTKARKAKSTGIAYFRSQYYLTTARRDLHKAVANNEDIFIATTIIGALVGYSFAIHATDFLLLFFKTAFDAAHISGTSMFFLSLAAFGSLTVLLGWIAAFMFNMQSIALMESMTGKQYRSIRRTVRKGLKYSSRVASVWALQLGIMLAPLVLVAGAAYTYISVAAMSLNDVVALAPYLGGAAALVMLAVLLRYSLAPYAALFEPELSLRQSLKRSSQLVKRRGRIFLLATYITLVAASAGIYGLATALEQLIGLPVIATCSLLGLTTLMATNGILVMLYRKRKLARKN